MVYVTNSGGQGGNDMPAKNNVGINATLSSFRFEILVHASNFKCYCITCPLLQARRYQARSTCIAMVRNDT
jgi:hypothetical protein